MKHVGMLRRGSILAVAGLVLMPGMAQAGVGGGTITFEPLGATAIPTLGGVMLVILSLLLALVGVLILRRNRRAGGGTAVSLAAGALVAGSLASGAGGVKLVQYAQAQVPCPPDCEVSDPQGGTFNVLDNANNSYRNTSGVTLRVSELTLHGGCAFEGFDPPTPPFLEPANEIQQDPICEEDGQVSDGEACVILCQDIR